MAQLDPAPPTTWTTAQTRDQLRAVAWLRWRITVNQFRKKGSTGELVGSIIMWLIFAGFAISLMGAAFATAWLAVGTNHIDHLDIILWAAFVISQFLNIQVGQPDTVFDPTQLIRFPMNARIYVVLRLFFGLISPANVLIALLSISIATGITVGDPSLFVYAFTAMFAFAITNALFSRMVFAWVDRWLATRRSREIFTALIFLFSLGLQWANVTFNPAYHHAKHSANSVQQAAQGIVRAKTVYHTVQLWLRPLPPGLIASAMVSAQSHHLALWAMNVALCAAFAAVFYAIFAWRTTTEFHGESLSDTANAVKSTPKSARVPVAHPASPLAPSTTPQTRRSGTVVAVLQKEILQIRRNVGLFMGIIAPIFFVFIFAGKVASRSNASWIFPAALLYVMMGLAQLSFNVFGLENEGAQLYFMAPIRIADVLFAKNIVTFVMASIDTLVTIAVIRYVSVLPEAPILISCVLWVGATILVSTLAGNRRSITTPKRIEPGRISGKQASQVSALISFGILLASAAVGGSLLLLNHFLGHPWMLPPIFAALAVAAWWFYRNDLNRMDAFAYDHRESLLLALAKKAAA